MSRKNRGLMPLDPVGAAAGGNSPKSAVLPDTTQLAGRRGSQSEADIGQQDEKGPRPKKKARVAADAVQELDEDSVEGRSGTPAASQTGAEASQTGGATVAVLTAKGCDIQQAKRNFWAMSKGVKMNEIVKARNSLTTYGHFGLKQDVLYDEPGYAGSSEEEEQVDDTTLIPEAFEQLPPEQQPRGPAEK